MTEVDEKNVDQRPLAEDLSEKIKYEFLDYFLVKPLDPVRVKKEFQSPKTDKTAVKDENGIEAVDFDEVETEIKEVDANFRRGIVLKLPRSFYTDENVKSMINIGDVVIFPEGAGKYFDLLKDSRLVRYYDVIAIER